MPQDKSESIINRVSDAMKQVPIHDECNPKQSGNGPVFAPPLQGHETPHEIVGFQLLPFPFAYLGFQAIP